MQILKSVFYFVLALSMVQIEAAEHTTDTLAAVRKNIDDQKAVLVSFREPWAVGN